MNRSCRSCGAEMDDVVEEVDIGVGVQTFVVALHCHKCDDGIGLCNGCGKPNDEWHATWCREVKP